VTRSAVASRRCLPLLGSAAMVTPKWRPHRHATSSAVTLFFLPRSLTLRRLETTLNARSFASVRSAAHDLSSPGLTRLMLALTHFGSVAVIGVLSVAACASFYLASQRRRECWKTDLNTRSNEQDRSRSLVLRRLRATVFPAANRWSQPAFTARSRGGSPPPPPTQCAASRSAESRWGS
jgi:hypothetical protein